MRRTTLGDLELDLLRFVASHGPTTTREAYDKYGEPNGLARSTIETVLSRLHKKGLLKRGDRDGAICYEPDEESQTVMSQLVEQFVQRTFGGSLVPLVTCFVSRNQLSASEIAALKELASKLEPEKKEEGS